MSMGNYHVALYAERQRTRLCSCGRKRVPGYKKCAHCRRVQKARSKSRKLSGLCLCGKPVTLSKESCNLCLEKAAMRRANKKKKGKCQCGRKPKRGSKVCKFCQSLGSAARARIKLAGLCHCGQPPDAEFVTCSRCRSNAKARYIRRMRSDEKFVATAKIRGSIIYGIIRSKGAKKAHSSEVILGCTIAFAREHIEKQFALGMSWGNRHIWQIDHYIPCNAFNLTDERQQRLCNNWRNLRPMWEKDNLLKGYKFPKDFKQCMAELEANVP